MVQDENLLAGVERLSRCAIPLSSGAAGENEKTGGPCRAIEIVAVMRLTTSSARLESNVPERDSVLLGFWDRRSKMSDREELKSRIVAVGSRPAAVHASRIRPIKPWISSSKAGFYLRLSVLECDADSIVLPPDHAAPANGVKIIECQFKVRRQDVNVSQLYSRAAIGDIPNHTSEDAARRIEKYQRALRDRRSADGSSFNHRSPPIKTARWGVNQALSKPTDHSIDIGTVELNRSGLEYPLSSRCTTRAHFASLG
jgi:hypothetical protein